MSSYVHLDLSEVVLQKLHMQAERLQISPEKLIEMLLNYLDLFQEGAHLAPLHTDPLFQEQVTQSLASHYDLLCSLPVESSV